MLAVDVIGQSMPLQSTPCQIWRYPALFGGDAALFLLISRDQGA